MADIAVCPLSKWPGQRSPHLKPQSTRNRFHANAGLNWNLFPEGVEGWVAVASAIGPLPLSRVCRYFGTCFIIRTLCRCKGFLFSWSGLDLVLLLPAVHR